VVNYRFTVPNGTYQLELRFAELKAVDPNDRIFDVVVEGQLAIPALDIADEVGDFTADDHTVVVEVTDGVLNVRIIARQGFMTPILNGLRATDRRTCRPERPFGADDGGPASSGGLHSSC